jgi:ABC-type uncharacterized transport system involved in gliding motility auxiliary subunit
VNEVDEVKDALNVWINRLLWPGLALVAGAGVGYSVQQVWTTAMTVSAVIGAGATVASLIARRNQIRTGLIGRQGRYGMNSATSVILLIAVLGIVNYLGVGNDQRMDLTSEGFNSLAQQSEAVAGELAEPVHIRAFYPGGDDAVVRQLLDLYQNESSEITYEFIDPDSQPQLAAQFEVTVYGLSSNPLTGQNLSFGTLVMEMGEFEERVESQATLREEDVTNALMKLAKGEQKAIYFIAGHGEKSIDSSESAGLDSARGALEREGYRVETINLIAEPTIPEDAAVLVWAGPENEPFEVEIERVDAFLNEGGSVMVMVDPAPSVSLEGLLDRWSISVGNDFVVDASGVGRLLGAGPEIPLVLDYGSHVITNEFSGVMTFFPLARSVTATAGPTSEVTTSSLLMTSPRSWGETDLENNQASLDPEVDLPGPVSIGVVATKNLASEQGEGQMARLVAVGDSEFAGNGYFSQQGNGDLFLNMVSWLAEDESFISIRPKVPEDRPLTMTAAGSRISLYLSMILLPLAIVSTGVSVWLKRRSQ